MNALEATNAAAKVRDLSVWSLANTADCGTPDSETSAGAGFLKSVAYSVSDLMEEFDEDGAPRDLDDRITEIADGAPDVYTHGLWVEFTDLAGYREDPSEIVGDEHDMTKLASVCLYIIAERLARELVKEYAPSDTYLSEHA